MKIYPWFVPCLETEKPFSVKALQGILQTVILTSCLPVTYTHTGGEALLRNESKTHFWGGLTTSTFHSCWIQNKKTRPIHYKSHVHSLLFLVWPCAHEDEEVKASSKDTLPPCILFSCLIRRRKLQYHGFDNSVLACWVCFFTSVPTSLSVAPATDSLGRMWWISHVIPSQSMVIFSTHGLLCFLLTYVCTVVEHPSCEQSLIFSRCRFPAFLCRP